jgi:long-subunit acyl-CoA synthetase (AMP-forming)
MYTSGTMGTPKCVQLTHKNILSQQAAIQSLLGINEHDRFLSYLPWHHSFGGIFELFSALYSGATYALESSYGKDPNAIFDNWRQIRPTVFFSVPKVYQSLFDLTRASNEAEDILFNSGLKFIFTAAAALSERLSDEFEKRGIPVVEGWGLTETSPCCTLTDPSLKRAPGVVGKPIPGVSIRIADDGEIQVKGPNVMVSYYHNDEANEHIFTPDGWYRTGDVGEITENGLKLISRKDRIFKLSNGEKVIPTDLERAIELKCHYVQYAVVSGNGEQHPVALIFPNKKMLEKPDFEITPEEGCFCPRTLNELGRCLTGCLEKANESIGQKFAKIKSAAIILDELSLDSNTLTPSMKMAPKNVVEKYRAHLLNLYGESVPVDEEVYVIELETKKTTAACTK